jgi:phosphoribosylglycinamide formyltransferase-1
MTSRGLPIAAMISGGGRTLMNLLDRRDQGKLAIDVPIVISSRAGAAGNDKARARRLRVEVVARKDFASDEAMHERITTLLRESGAELVCLCGYLRWLHIEPDFRGRVMNIHPALLPDFGGHTFHGEAVHRAVLGSGAKQSGCTVHFVDEHYDQGPIILQKTCPVLPDDTVETLAARVFELECEAYPEAIRLFANGRLRIEGGRARILPESASNRS